MNSWLANVNHVRSLFKVYIEVLEMFARVNENLNEFQHDVSPQTDGQSERIIQILENVLTSVVVDKWGNWEEIYHW